MSVVLVAQPNAAMEMSTARAEVRISTSLFVLSKRPGRGRLTPRVRAKPAALLRRGRCVQRTTRVRLDASAHNVCLTRRALQFLSLPRNGETIVSLMPSMPPAQGHRCTALRLLMSCLAPMLLGSCDSSSDDPGPSETGGSSGAAGRGGDTQTGGRAGGISSGSGGASAGMGGGSAGSAGGDGGHAGATVCHHDADGVMTLRFVNGCGESLAFRGSDIQGGTLAPAEAACVILGSATETLSAKRYWGFVGDDPGAGHYTLGEFTFNTDFNDFDWYNISHVDAHNVPMQIVP